MTTLHTSIFRTETRYFSGLYLVQRATLAEGNMMETLKKMSLKVKMLVLGAVALILGFVALRKLSIPPPEPDGTRETEIKLDAQKKEDELVKKVEEEAAARKTEADKAAKKAEKEAEKAAETKKVKLTREAKEKPNKFSKKVEKELGLKDKTKRPYKKRK